MPAKQTYTQKQSVVRTTYTLKIVIGNLEFSNIKGDFLGEVAIAIRTRQYSEISFALNDFGGETRAVDKLTNVPQDSKQSAGQNLQVLSAKDISQSVSDRNLLSTGSLTVPKIAKPDLFTPSKASTPDQKLDGSLWSQILANEGAAVTVSLGYDGTLEEVLKGKAYRIGRKLPDKVIIDVVDDSASLATSTQPGVVATAENPAPNPFASADPSAFKVSPQTVLKQLKGGSGVASPTTAGSLSVAPGSGSLFATGNPPKPDPKQADAIAQQSQSAKSATPNGSPGTDALKKAVSQNPSLTFSKQTQQKTGDVGAVSFTQSPLKSASSHAALTGDVVVADGNTIKQVGPGQAESTGIVLSWNSDRECFIRPPTITKKTPYQLQSGTGALTVQGWSVNDKSVVSATVVTQSPPPPHPTGNIQVPQWGQVKLKDPIYPGSKFTWGDASRNGERVPENQNVMKGIVLAAKTLDAIAAKYGGGIQITSWYRPPRVNAAVSGSGLSGPHTTGSAVDFYHPKMTQIHADYSKSWQGGVAISPGSFTHIDWVGHPEGLPGSPRRRWSY
jgi:Peptidase M15